MSIYMYPIFHETLNANRVVDVACYGFRYLSLMLKFLFHRFRWGFGDLENNFTIIAKFGIKYKNYIKCQTYNNIL